LKADQRKWLTIRNNCKDIECLKEVYVNRIGDLDRYTTQAAGDRPPGSEAIPIGQRFLGSYRGTTKNIKEGPHGRMAIEIEPSDREGHAQLKLTTWDGLKVAGNLDAEISPDGRLGATGIFYEPATYVFRESRAWDCNLTGMIIENTFKGTYSCFPKTVTGRNCPPIPGYPCASTNKMEGSFDLEKFKPLVQPQ
jgi:hypothetical protein